MTLVELIPLAIKISMGLIVFGLGLGASLQDASCLIRRPGLLARSLLSMNVIMPVFAAAVAALFDLHPAVKIALIALAVSPVPPILPKKQQTAGGTASYSVGLLVTMAACAIVLVPAAIKLLGRAFGAPVTVPVSTVALVVLVSVMAPLIGGLVVRRFAPDVADRIARPVSLVATVLLGIAFLPILVAIWPAMMAMVGNGTLLALAVFTLVGVAVGHLLGGPNPDDRSVLALATGTRHPGVALAIAGATFPEEKAVLAVVLWHLIVGAIVSLPYVNWRKRSHAGVPAKVGPS